MSVQVLLALVDPELFKSLSQEEIDHGTRALVAEIESDAQLKQRLSDAVGASVAELLARKSLSPANTGS